MGLVVAMTEAEVLELPAGTPLMMEVHHRHGDWVPATLGSGHVRYPENWRMEGYLAIHVSLAPDMRDMYGTSAFPPRLRQPTAQELLIMEWPK
jgi:hypothetical protein